MLNRSVVFVLVVFISVIISGCAKQDSYNAQITGVVPGLHQSQNTQIPIEPVKPLPRKESVRIAPSTPTDWKPPRSVEKNWSAIIIHHSATDKGSEAIFDKDHKSNNGWVGIGYDFVIGNGNGSSNGQVEVTFRWQQQKTGAHCKTDYTNWANKDAIGICLVGNFNKTSPTSRQTSSLLRLVRFLSKRYNIPKSRIYGHNTTPRHNTATDCPGKRFPMANFKSRL